MNLLDPATAIVLPFAWLYLILALAWRTRNLLKRPFKGERAPARGDGRFGAFYALTFAMLPWKKESTRTHWATYTAGMLMHLGIFAVVFFAAARMLNFGEMLGALLAQTMGLTGLVMALGLFVKRVMNPAMRAISSPDDFLSNLLVDLCLLGGVLTAFDEGNAPWWRLSVIVLLLWIPVGKIYHMVLFFVSRVLFGLQFSHRGVIRHAKPISY